MKTILILTALFSTTVIAGENFKELAEKNFRTVDNSFTVHITSSPKVLSWDKTARNLLVGIVSNQYLRKKRTKRSIGHVTIEFNCKNPETGEITHRFGGQGAVDLGQYNAKILKDGHGFGIMLTPEHVEKHGVLNNKQLVTIEGKMEKVEDLEKEYDENIHKKNLMGFVTYKTSFDTCQEMVNFYDEYYETTIQTAGTDNPLAGNNYGFGADTKLLQGAGCATFVQAFFEIAGLENHYRNFFETVYVNPEHIGDPKNGRKVKLSKVMLSFNQLDKEKKNRLKLQIPSPDRMFTQLKSVVSNKSDIFLERKVLKSQKLGETKAYHVILE